jgi:iron-sulfur cluster repair protein YtfE (RIC family)
MNSTQDLTAELTVNETIRIFPQTVSVFRELGIDSCCGGGLAVGEAARRHGHDAEAVLAQLRQVAEAAG